MRRLLGLAFVALALSLAGVNTFAATMKEPTRQVATASTEVKGEITHIKGHTLMLKDEAGKAHLVKATEAKMFEGLKVGDRVDVKLENGKAVSVEKI
jgi:hypothetical protein